MKWTKFADANPTENGDYWIYRDSCRPLPRITIFSFSNHYGWGISFVNAPSDWTHWMKIEKPKAPK